MKSRYGPILSICLGPHVQPSEAANKRGPFLEWSGNLGKTYMRLIGLLQLFMFIRMIFSKYIYNKIVYRHDLTCFSNWKESGIEWGAIVFSSMLVSSGTRDAHVIWDLGFWIVLVDQHKFVLEAVCISGSSTKSDVVSPTFECIFDCQ